MSGELTADKVKEAVASALKEATGMTAAEFSQFRNELKAKDEVVRRQYADDLVASNNREDRATLAFAKHDRHQGLGLKAGRALRAAVLAGQTRTSPQDVAIKFYNDKDLANAFAVQEKTLVANTGASGGFIVPNEYVAEVIELLRAKAVIRSTGCRQIPMKSGTLTMPRQSAAATASYAGEAANITSSQPSFEQIQLVMKKLTALVPVSNDLLRESSPSVDALVRDDLVRIMALKEDLSFIRGDGTQNAPKGLRYRTNSSNINAMTAASPPATLAEITNDLFLAIKNVEAANIDLINACWVFHARTKYGLMRIRDSFGHLVFAEEMATGKLFGYPFFVSNQIPTNLGGGTESEVYFLEPTQCLIADTYDLMVDVVPNGAYYDGSAVQSGLSQDLTIIRAISAHDFAMRHDLGASVITGVTWGT